MASVIVSVPPELYVEIPPTVLYAELCNQRDQATPGTPASNFNVEDPVWPTDKATATMRARVLSAYFGVVPLDMQHIVVGVGQNPEAVKLANQLFKKVRENIQTERYGRGSFIQEFVKGKVSTLDFRTLVTNWTLDARICEIVVAGETPAAVPIRDANRTVYETALTELLQLWRDTYEQAFQSASANVGVTRRLKKKRYERARGLYRIIKDNLPAPSPNIGQLSAHECEQAKGVPFAFRAKQDRLAGRPSNPSHRSHKIVDNSLHSFRSS
ncbi:unnamed protein product [Alternaria alternata]